MTRSPRVHAQWTLLLIAVQTLTRIPVAPDYGAGSLREATRWFPLVGAAIGLAAAALFTLAEPGLTALLAALLSTAATLLLTGALHEDGLADSADGLFGGRTRADALRIMQDSRIGAFGALGLGLVLAAKVACLATLPRTAPYAAACALVAAHAASRFWLLLPATLLPYARTAGLAASVARPRATDLAIAAACGLPPLLLLGPRAGPALLLSAAVAALFGLWVRHRLGGYTGDTLGATQQLTELAILLAAVWQAT